MLFGQNGSHTNDFHVVTLPTLSKEIVRSDYVSHVNFVVGRKLFTHSTDKIIRLSTLNNEGTKERNDPYGYLDNFSNCVRL